MDSNEYLLLAESTLESDDALESECRIAAENAYYAAFFASEWLDNALADHAGIQPGSGVHRQRSSKFQSYQTMSNAENISQPLSMNIRAIGIALHNLHGMRVRARYKLDETFSLNDSRTALESAKILLTKLHELRAKIESDHPGLLFTGS